MNISKIRQKRPKNLSAQFFHFFFEKIRYLIILSAHFSGFLSLLKGLKYLENHIGHNHMVHYDISTTFSEKYFVRAYWIFLNTYFISPHILLVRHLIRKLVFPCDSPNNYLSNKHLWHHITYNLHQVICILIHLMKCREIIYVTRLNFKSVSIAFVGPLGTHWSVIMCLQPKRSIFIYFEIIGQVSECEIFVARD